MNSQLNLSSIPAQQVHVLLAEDNLTFQRVLKMMLEKKGLAISTAANGLEAIEQNERYTFDAILMDINMPEMGGIEAANAIKQLKPYLPILAFTSHEEGFITAKINDGTFNAYVSKFATPDEIVRSIDAHMNSPLAKAV